MRLHTGSKSGFAIRDEDVMPRFRVWMRSVPAMGRTFYDGKVDVFAKDYDDAIERAKQGAFTVHGHMEWLIDKVEPIK